MPSALFVAYYFPPIGGIGSIRLARFASLLPEHGWNVTVLAPRQTPHPGDPRLAFAEERVIRSRSIELSTVGRTALRAGDGAGASPEGTRSMRATLRRSAHRYLYYPDGQIGWYPGAVAAGLQATKHEKFDVVYSSSNPVTAHLIARTLSRRRQIPWVAEYRDPWSDRLPSDSPHARRAASLEHRIASEAARVVMPTPTWALHYGERWETDIAVLPNGADEALPPPRPSRHSSLVHLGTYYPGEHDLTSLWGALARMREENREQVPIVRFVGNVPNELREELERFKIADLLEETGFIAHDEAMREVMSASMLVGSGIHGADALHRGWVPAKLFEYLASDLPILCVADAESDVARLLTGQPGCQLVAPGDVDQALVALRAGLASPGPQGRDTAAISRSARAEQLAALLDRVRQAS